MSVSKSFSQLLQDYQDYKGYTNKVLYYLKTENQVEYFLPAYLRLVVKKVSEFNYSQSKAKLIATLLLTIRYDQLQGVEYQQLQYILKKNMVIDINGELIQLNESNEKVVIKTNQPYKNYISYTYRDYIQIELSSEVFLTPFEKIYGYFHVSLKTIQKLKLPIKMEQLQQDSSSQDIKLKPIKKSLKHIATFKFNLMDDIQHQIGKRFQYKGLEKVMGYYELKTRNFGVQYYEKDFAEIEATNNFLKDINFENKKYDRILNSLNKKQKKVVQKQQKQKKQIKQSKKQQGKKDKSREDTKIKIWQNAIFKFEFARHSFIQLVTIMVPLWILSILNLPIFFQELALGARISQIATILLAFTAYLPTMRQRIPPSSTLTLIQINIYLLISTSLLCLLRSFIAYQDDPDGKNLDYKWKEDNLFIICLIINISSFGIVLIMYILQTYNNFTEHQKYQLLKDKKKGPKSSESRSPFQYADWYNLECDFEFKKNDKIFTQNLFVKRKVALKDSQKSKQKQLELTKCMHEQTMKTFKKQQSVNIQSENNQIQQSMLTSIVTRIGDRKKEV